MHSIADTPRSLAFEWRPLRKGELDHELIWLSVTAATALFGVLWLSLGMPWPRCTFQALTGVPCFTCGSTRAAVAFLHGELGSAFRWNPMAAAGFIAILAYDAYAAAVLLFGLPRLRLRGPGTETRKTLVRLLVILALINWVYLLVR